MSNISRTRRECLAVGGTIGLVTLAGCSSDETADSSSDENDVEGDSNNDETTESGGSNDGEMTELQSITAVEGYYDPQRASFDQTGATQTETWQHSGGIMVVNVDFENSFDLNLLSEDGESTNYEISSTRGLSRVYSLSIKEGRSYRTQ